MNTISQKYVEAKDCVRIRVIRWSSRKFQIYFALTCYGILDEVNI